MRLAELEHERKGPIVRARLRGEVDMSNAGELLAALTSSMPNDALGLALDLSEVEYLDSAGIHLIYRLRESLKARGQDIRLIVPSDSVVSDTLRLAGIEREKETVETLAEAERALTPNRDPSACSRH